MVPTPQEHRIPVIYLIIHVASGRIYVGSAKDWYKRYTDYAKLRGTTKATRHIEYAIKKHGFDQFVFTILEEVTELSQLLAREQHYLDTLRPWDLSVGFNICRVAQSRLGIKHTEASKAKMSASLMGRYRSPETIEKQRAAMIGQKRSPEARARMSAAARKIAQATGERASVPVLKIDPVTHEVLTEYPSIRIAADAHGVACSSISGVLNGHYTMASGHLWAYKRGFDPAAFKPRPIMERRSGARGTSVRPVEQLDAEGTVVKMWDSAREAARVLDMAFDAIGSACREGGTRKGFRWRFVTDEETIKAVKARLRREWEVQHGSSNG